MKPQCDTCRYWERELSDDGSCRRHPPVILQLHGYASTVWPSTSSWDWCGEYEPAEGELPTQVSGGE